jgi:plasmid stabilization system protein ParE
MAVSGSSGKALNIERPLASIVDVIAIAASTPATGRLRAAVMVLRYVRGPAEVAPYVEALGGEIEVVANFGDKRIRLHSV